MALSDIMLSDELDGATMYSNIVDDRSEAELMSLLLKQSTSDVSVNQEFFNSSEQHDKAIIKIIISSIAFVILLIIYFYIRFEGFRNILKHIVAIVGLVITLFIAGILISEYSFDFYWDTDKIFIVSLTATFVLSSLGNQ